MNRLIESPEPFAVLTLSGFARDLPLGDCLIPVAGEKRHFRLAPRPNEHYAFEALRLLFLVQRLRWKGHAPLGILLHCHFPLRCWLAEATGQSPAPYLPDTASARFAIPDNGVRLDFAIARPWARAGLVPWNDLLVTDLDWHRVAELTSHRVSSRAA